jgi:hypothetical protein
VKKKAICEEEDCSTRTTNKLAEEGGQWRRTNKFVKKAICKDEDWSQGRLFARKKAICEEEGNLRGGKLFAKKKVVREEEGNLRGGRLFDKSD